MKKTMQCLIALLVFVSGLSMAGGPPTVPTAMTVPTKTILTGWNLLGNGHDQPINVVEIFGKPGSSTSMTSGTVAIWKWSNINYAWEFYSPQISESILNEFVKAKGYQVLTSIDAGEGFWVQATEMMEMPIFGTTSDSIIKKWLEVASKDGWSLNAVPPSNTGNSWTSWTAGNISSNLTSLPPDTQSLPGLGTVETMWKWDRNQGMWSVYAPILLTVCGVNATGNFANNSGHRLWFQYETVDDGGAYWLNRHEKKLPLEIPQNPDCGVQGAQG